MITFHTLSNDVVVHQHTAEENAVNAYLIETPEEVVAIDATFVDEHSCLLVHVAVR